MTKYIRFPPEVRQSAIRAVLENLRGEHGVVARLQSHQAGYCLKQRGSH